jgi:hypothetical protein
VAQSDGLKCDFCGREALQVRRVALDQGYDRLGQRHAVRYACPECSEKKERERSQPSASGDSKRPLGG